MSDESWDAIVIGAGLSGLAAGIRLSYFGRRVLVVEQHAVPGGLNSFYRRSGRIIDVGLHAMTNWAGPRDRRAPLNTMLRQLKLNRDQLPMAPQRFSQVVFPGCRLRFSNDPEELEQNIHDNFPGQIDGFRRLVQDVQSSNPFLIEPGGFQSARQYLSSFIDEPLLKEMLLCAILFYGSAWERDVDRYQFQILFRSIFLEGLFRPVEGMQTFLATLVDKFRQNAGTLLLGCRVSAIDTAGNRVTGVQLEDGTAIAAGQIFSTIGLWETQQLCPNPLTYGSVVPGWISIVELLFSLREPLATCGHEAAITFFNNASEFQYRVPSGLADYSSGVICVPDNFCGARSQQPSLRITHLANFEPWNALSASAYSEKKQQVQEQVIEHVGRLIRLDRSLLADWDMFTPKTILRFTGHHAGSVYGTGTKCRDGCTRLANLYLCGTDQGYLGIVGSLLSGISIANAHGARLR